ncbi:MAG: hypothetical protein ACXVED_20105, partial [Bacteroidia bacterium]
MNLLQAKSVSQKLQGYVGKVMKPFDKVVKEFIIVPKEQKDFDMMFKNIVENKKSFEEALTSYSDSVTIIVYFENAQNEHGASHCNIE